MLLEFEGTASEGPGGIEDRIAIYETTVSNRDSHLAFRKQPAVEEGDVIVFRHGPASFSGLITKRRRDTEVSGDA